MDKLEIIKNTYGKYYSIYEKYIDKDTGWCSDLYPYNITRFDEVIKLFDIDMIITRDNDEYVFNWIPKELLKLDDNNGWTIITDINRNKILNGLYQVRILRSGCIDYRFNDYINGKLPKNATHYKKLYIIEPIV